MTQKQFEKFATGVISGLQTMEDLRKNKTSLFETYPVLTEGDNWHNLVIFARGKGLTPVCNHIRVARSLSQVVDILIQRGYNSVGQIKYLRPLINLYIKVNTVGWDYKDLLADWKEFVKNNAEHTLSIAYRDYTYNNVLKEVSKLVFSNPVFKVDIVSAIGAGLLNLENPVQFVKDWYSYTDFEGNLLVPVSYINEDNTIITSKWELKPLKTSVAQSVLENALRNVNRCFKAGKLGRKFTPLKRVAQGSLTGQYWSVVTNDKGLFTKGDKLIEVPDGEVFKTTLADRNKENKE